MACRALAERVAAERGTRLGHGVGYRVRDDDRTRADTHLIYATPGIALAAFDELLSFDTIVLDELHERRLDVDLLLALLRREFKGQLVIMSATFEAKRVAEALEGVALEGEGRTFPVETRFLEHGVAPPDLGRLEERFDLAMARAADDPGDVLMFLPGKAEIARMERHADRRGLEIVTLHGGLSLKEQSRVFAPSPRRKLILATNVAETSITVPGVGVVIDSGLVRRTRYHQGYGSLTLVPIANDSALQRQGRAGRMQAGVAYPLWGEGFRLAVATPPEIHRESLVPLVLGAASRGVDVRTLEFLDAPREHAIEAAEEELRALGALEVRERDAKSPAPPSLLTRAGQRLARLPLAPGHARWLVEAQGTSCAPDVLDLVAALSTGRALFQGRVPGAGLLAPDAEIGPDEDPRRLGCDARALMAAIRGAGSAASINRIAIIEARRLRDRLGRALQIPAAAPDAPVDRRALAACLLAADPRLAHVARRRKKRIGWANGGTELDLARESSAQLRVEPPPGERPVEALIVLERRAFGSGRELRLLATAAMPIPLGWLDELGFGQERVASVARKQGRIVATLERVYAKRTLSSREAVPTGAAAREAVAILVLRGSLFKGTAERIERRLLRSNMASALAETAVGERLGLTRRSRTPAAADWLAAHLADLGFDDGADISLLTAEDLLPEPLPKWERDALEREFPLEVDLGDVLYRAEVDASARRVTLRTIRGGRAKPPPASYLPRYTGFRVFAEAGGTTHLVRR